MNLYLQRNLCGLKITNNIVLVEHPKVKTEEFETGITYIFEGCDQKQHIFQQKSDQLQGSSENLSLKKLRKNKQDKLKQISEQKTDDGRGGNCVAANLTKTMIRIIDSNLKNTSSRGHNLFRNLLKKYEIRSQKENTFILILILHTLVKQQYLSYEAYEEIVNTFLESVKCSEQNCSYKMSEEPKRREFHSKNKKMYCKFAEIMAEIYQQSCQNLMNGSKFSLKSLQAIISDVYQRKERETEKSILKIFSIVLNHDELKELFGCYEIDIQASFMEAVDFAFRRNLPKKCKQSKQKILQMFEHFKSLNTLQNEEDKYMMCYMAVNMVEEKNNIIWEQFILNLIRKQEFNKTKQELQKLRYRLEQQIPSQFAMMNLIKQIPSERIVTADCFEQKKLDQVKIEDESEKHSKIFEAYQQFLRKFEF